MVFWFMQNIRHSSYFFEWQSFFQCKRNFTQHAEQLQIFCTHLCKHMMKTEQCRRGRTEAIQCNKQCIPWCEFNWFASCKSKRLFFKTRHGSMTVTSNKGAHISDLIDKNTDAIYSIHKNTTQCSFFFFSSQNREYTELTSMEKTSSAVASTFTSINGSFATE